MTIRQILGMKPRTLGEGLKRVKKQFKVKGENLSTVAGERQYNCYSGNELLNIRTSGKPFDSCLVMTVNSKKKDPLGNEYFGRDLIGKTSDITKSYARKHIYKDGMTGSFQEFRVAREIFKRMQNGKIESYPNDISRDTKVIEPWLFDRISDSYEG